MSQVLEAERVFEIRTRRLGHHVQEEGQDINARQSLSSKSLHVSWVVHYAILEERAGQSLLALAPYDLRGELVQHGQRSPAAPDLQRELIALVLRDPS